MAIILAANGWHVRRWSRLGRNRTKCQKFEQSLVQILFRERRCDKPSAPQNGLGFQIFLQALIAPFSAVAGLAIAAEGGIEGKFRPLQVALAGLEAAAYASRPSVLLVVKQHLSRVPCCMAMALASCV